MIGSESCGNREGVNYGREIILGCAVESAVGFVMTSETEL